MVRPLQIQVGDHHLDSSMGLAIGLFVSASVVATLCAKHARRVSRNHSANSASNDHDQSSERSRRSMQESYDQKRVVPKSPLMRSPKKFITSISNKAITPLLMYHKKSGDGDHHHDQSWKGEKLLEDEGFGEGGLWQKDILMGEKCQPHEFSGVIYYDCDGKQISELPPRSPRASTHVPAFSFPVLANDQS